MAKGAKAQPTEKSPSKGQGTKRRRCSWQTTKIHHRCTCPDPILRWSAWKNWSAPWELKGRTLDSKEDNISGWSTFEWLPGGFFLQISGEITFKGLRIQSMEIIAYDPTSQTFPANVYSDMSGTVLSYQWNVQGNIVTHWTKGAKYTGTFSEDGNILTGGWRPDEGAEVTDGATYDATMIRVQGRK
jgi:hypothetical protein